MFVWHRQRLPRVVQLKPTSLPFPLHESSSPVACGQPALAKTTSHGPGHAPRRHPFLSRRVKATRSHEFLRSQEHGFIISPAPLHINPRQQVDLRFQPVKHPGSTEDATYLQLYRCNTVDGNPGRCALRNGGILQMQTIRYPGVITCFAILLTGLWV